MFCTLVDYCIHFIHEIVLDAFIRNSQLVEVTLFVIEFLAFFLDSQKYDDFFLNYRKLKLNVHTKE